LHAHPDGPLVAAAAITHDTWQVAAVELGGTKVTATQRPHRRSQARVLDAVAAELSRVSRRFGTRVRAAAVAVPGTVAGRELVHAPGLAWHSIDLSALWPRYGPGGEFVAGNDASLAGVAESRHGAGAGAGAMVYLHLDAGLGGTLVEAGRAVRGATGAAGEFGHMPFGEPARRCRCGARGCWNTSVDGRAVARLLHQRVPADDVSYFRRVLASARAGQPGALSAIRTVGSSVGRGIAGLVNGLDPHLVVVGGLGPDLLQIAAGEVTAAYRDGLMPSARRRPRRSGRPGSAPTGPSSAPPTRRSPGCSPTRACRPGSHDRLRPVQFSEAKLSPPAVRASPIWAIALGPIPCIPARSASVTWVSCLDPVGQFAAAAEHPT
jgi:predicted NBD/HSP70 family sugar kinase